MAFCAKCGRTLTNEDRFCPKCGAPNKLLVEAKPGATAAPVAGPAEEDPSGRTVLRPDTPYSAVNLERLPEGHVIDDRYEIKRKVGQGGFGAVYLAFDRRMTVDKALKIIPEAVVNDIESMSHLRAEARTMLKLNHPNIVRVYDFHESGQMSYIDMEYVDGKNLSVVKLEQPDKRLDEGLVNEFALQIAAGMHYAHSQRVIHKDIKPQNILLSNDRTIKIMDFGIAETVRSSMSRMANSSSSGTPAYMSPEQFRGKEVGPESDIYSFGVLVYELLNGQPPFFRGDIPYQVLNETPAPIEGASADWNEFLMKCLKKEYRERYRSFAEIVTALGGAPARVEVSAEAAARPTREMARTSVSVDEIVCPKCNTRNKETRKFCMSCSGPLYRVCPACEKEERIDMEICGNCGKSVEGYVKGIVNAYVNSSKVEELRNIDKWVEAITTYGVHLDLIEEAVQRKRREYVRHEIVKGEQFAAKSCSAPDLKELLDGYKTLVKYNIIPDEVAASKARALDGFVARCSHKDSGLLIDQKLEIVKAGHACKETHPGLMAWFVEVNAEKAKAEKRDKRYMIGLISVLVGFTLFVVILAMCGK